MTIVELRKYCEQCDYDRMKNWTIDEPVDEATVASTIAYQKSKFTSHTHNTKFVSNMMTEDEWREKFNG